MFMVRRNAEGGMRDEAVPGGRSLARPNHKRCPEGDPVAAALGGSDQRWKIVAPYFLVQKDSGVGGQLAADELPPMDSQLVVLFPVAQQQRKVILPACAEFAIQRSYLLDKGTGHVGNRAKGSKAVKNSSCQLGDNCILPNKLPGSDSTLAGSDNVFDSAVVSCKASEAVKSKSKKKGKKKGRHRKKPLHSKDCVGGGVVSEANFHDFLVSDVHQHLDVSNNASAPTPPFSDDLDGSEPLGSSFEESACGSSICDQPSLVDDACRQQISSDESQNCEIAVSSFDKNSVNAEDGKASSATESCSVDCSYQDKLSHSDSLSDRWESDIISVTGDGNVENVSCSRYQIFKGTSECQTVSKSCTLGSSVPDSCVRITDVGGNSIVHSEKELSCVADRFACLNENGPCEISNMCKLSIPKKRRHTRESFGNSSSFCRVGSQNPHGNLRRDTGHAIWQRVENRCVEGYSQKRRVPHLSPDTDVFQDFEGRSENDNILPQHYVKNNSSRFPCSEKKSCSDAYPADSSSCPLDTVDCKIGIDTQMVVVELKNSGSVFNGRGTRTSRACSGTANVKTVMSCKTFSQEQNVVTKSLVVGSAEQQNPRFFANNNHQTTAFSSVCRSNIFPLKAQKDVQTHVNHTLLHCDSHCSVKVGNSDALHGQKELALGMSNSLEQRGAARLQPDKPGNMYETEVCSISPPSLCSLEIDMTPNIPALHVENCNNDHISVSPKQKWVPVGRKAPHVVASNLCELISDKEIPKSNEKSTTHFTNLLFIDQTPKISPLPINNADSVTSSIGKSVPVLGEKNGVPMSNGIMSFDSDLGKIIQTVRDAHGLQTASEFAHKQFGGPLAEFEKVIHSTSPAICQISGLTSCRSCFHDRKQGDSLCSHQIPNISLGNLWRWYEKHGSYGLEVKVEDQHNKKLGLSSKFRAYFVPYLSAVQLFRNSKSNLSAKSTDPIFSEKESSDLFDRLNVSVVSSCLKNASEMEKLAMPISGSAVAVTSTILLPEPSQAEPGEILECLFPKDCLGKCNPGAACTENDETLLFEYFESDPPQQRPPLFEKIKMLVRGDRSLNSQTFGDPSNLERLHLQDIDPASWFSVAWYPIYRIPDGNLRAAFLTYHCLGNFTQRAEDDNVSYIISPAIGLQSYNSRGECWFQLGDCKGSLDGSKALPMNPSQILEGRLRTLNQTAAVMARASIRKQGKKSINRQPDYEFFVSRAW